MYPGRAVARRNGQLTENLGYWRASRLRDTLKTLLRPGTPVLLLLCQLGQQGRMTCTKKKRDFGERGVENVERGLRWIFQERVGWSPKMESV